MFFFLFGRSRGVWTVKEMDIWLIVWIWDTHVCVGMDGSDSHMGLFQCGPHRGQEQIRQYNFSSQFLVYFIFYSAQYCTDATG
jgi:hypothetical protein